MTRELDPASVRSSAASQSAPGFRRDWYALIAYLLLSIALTFPLVLHFTTHVTGDGSDDPALAWNLWWVRHAIFDLGESPIYTNHLFFPIGLNLAFYTLTYLNVFISIPIQFAFGLIPAANVNLLLSFMLSGFGAYLLVSYLLRCEFGAYASGAAFVAGLLYAFSSNKFLYASLGQFNIASSQWIPFYILFLLKTFPTWNTVTVSADPSVTRSVSHSKLHAFLLGLFLLLQTSSEFIFGSFLILFTAAYLVYWLLSNRFRIRDSRLVLRNLLIVATTFLIPMSPILGAMVSDLSSEGDFIQQGLGFSNSFSADLVGFLVPSHLHPIFGGLESQFHFPYINFVFVGNVALALALLALWRVPRARLWGLWSVLIFLLMLGPTLRVNGNEFSAPWLPFNLLLEIPFIKGNRYPSRWSVMLTLCLAVLVGYGLAWVLSRIASRRPSPTRRALNIAHFVFLALSGLLLFEHLSLPLPLSDLQIPKVYETIARDPGEFTIMELPLTWRNGFRVTGSYRAGSQGPIDRGFMLAQWYQSAHQHPILNGNTSRNPEFKFQYFAEMPFVSAFIAIQSGHEVNPGLKQTVKQIAPKVLRFLGTRYVIWHTPYEQVNRTVADKTRAFIEDVLPLQKISETYENGHGLVVYRVRNLPPPEFVIINQEKADVTMQRLYFGEGWAFATDVRVWAQRPEARIFARFDTHGRDAFIGLKGDPPPPFSEENVEILVNGRSVGKARLIDAPSDVGGVRVPANLLNAGMNEIAFRFEHLVPTAQVRRGNYLFNGCCNPPLNLLVRSAGEEQGDFAHIYVDGHDVSPNRRGYNLVVLDPNSRAVEASDAFDTFASDSESARLAQFIEMIPNGKLVAVAVRDEASLHLTEEAVNALKSLGAQQDLRGKFRWSHAFVAVKGAPEGTELEYMWENWPAEIIVGIGASEPNLAAGLEEIFICPEVEQLPRCR